MPTTPPLQYTPEPGETLAAVILRLYHVPAGSPRFDALAQSLLALNPHARASGPLDPRLPLRLVPPGGVASPAQTPSPAATPEPEPVLTPRQRREAWVMAWAQYSGLLLATGSVTFGAGASVLDNGNLNLLRQVSDEYAAYKQGRVTKQQYEQRRRLLIDRFRQKVGPLERLLFRGLRAPEAFRMARAGGIPYNDYILHHVQRLSRLGSMAARGGLVLTAIGVSGAGVQMAHTRSRPEQNEIVVDTVASTAAGALMGMPLGLFVASHPVGWRTSLVMAIGTAAASWMAGQAATQAYDRWGNQVDLVGGMGLDRLWQG